MESLPKSPYVKTLVMGPNLPPCFVREIPAEATHAHVADATWIPIPERWRETKKMVDSDGYNDTDKSESK